MSGSKDGKISIRGKLVLSTGTVLPPTSLGRAERERERERKREREKKKRHGIIEGGEKRELSIIKTGEANVSSRYRVSRAAGTLISPTGGFYRLQPPSDTRLVVKISDAPWAGERARPEQ